MFQTILFDLDGTITDPGIGITNSVMYALKKQGIEAPPREELYAFIGPPLRVSFEKFCGITGEAFDRALHDYRDNDILGAKGAGVFSGGVLWGYGSREELLDAGADRIFETPADLGEFLLQDPEA